MISHLIDQYPTTATLFVAALCLVVGYIERKIFGRIDLPCLTWLFGLIIGTMAIIGSRGLGSTRWLLASAIFVVGCILIVRYYRKERAKGD